MKLMIFILTVLLLILSDQGYSNPFQCKIPQKKPEEIQKEPVSNKLKLIGFAVIDKKHIAIIRIGDDSYEVISGDIVKDYHIININSSGISYTFSSKEFYLPLDIP